MKKRIVLYGIFFLLLAFVFVVSPISVNGAAPRYLLGAVVALSLSENEKIGAVFGLIFGLIEGFSDGAVFGVTALYLGVIGYVIGRFGVPFIRSRFPAALAASFAFCVLSDIARGVTGFFTSGTDLGDALLFIAFPKAVLTVAVTAAEYGVIRFIRVCRLWRNVDEEY